MKKNVLYIIILVALFISGCSQKVSDYVEYSSTSTEAVKQMKAGLRYQDNFAQRLARESFQKAVDLDPEFAMAYYSLAQTTGDAVQRYPIAEKGKQFASKANKGEKALMAVMDRDSWWGGEGDVDWFKEVEGFTKMFPKESRYVNMLAGMSSWGGDEEKAEAYYKQSLEVEENPDAFNSLGYLYSGQGKMEESKKAFERQIELAPDLANPYDSMGDYYLEKKDHKNAKKYFQKALSIDPKFVSSKRKIWKIEEEESGNDVSPTEWSSDSANAVNAFNVGFWQFYNIHWSKAREQFEKAVTIDPEFAMPYLFLVFTPGDSARSVEAKKIAQGLAPTASQYEQDMIEYYLYRMDNPDGDFSSRISKLKSNYPNKAFVMIAEAQNLYSKKEYKKAIKIYTMMWERYDFSPSLNMLGYSNMQLGNMKAAHNAFAEYIDNNRMHPNPYDSMGEYWEKMEEYQNAYDYYMMAYTQDSTFSISKERADALEDKK